MSDVEPQVQSEDPGGASAASAYASENDATSMPDGASVGATSGVTDGAAKGTGKGKTKTRRGHLPRRISAWVLLVLASILIPISVISVWAIRTVTDTDQYVETMAPLARNPVIQQGLATRTTDALFSTHIVQNKVAQSLPKSAKPLVAPLVSQLQTFVEGYALKVFESPKFAKLWDTLNRHSHDAVINTLTGKQTPAQKKLAKAGDIALNVSPALDQVITNLDARGITFFDPLRSLSTNSVHFTVVSKSQVSKFSGLFNLVVKLKWAIPAVALVLAALSVALALQRRKTLLRLAVGVALMSLLLLGLLAAARGIFIGQATGGGFNSQGSAAVWDTVLRFLKADLRWTLLASVLVALGAWVAGPARYAVWIRSHVALGARWLGTQSHELSQGAGRVVESQRVRRSAGWIEEHLNGLRIAGVAVAGLILVFGGNLTGWGLLVIVIVLAVYLGLLQLVAAWAHKVSGPGTGSGVGTSEPGSDAGASSNDAASVPAGKA